LAFFSTENYFSFWKSFFCKSLLPKLQIKSVLNCFLKNFTLNRILLVSGICHKKGSLNITWKKAFLTWPYIKFDLVHLESVHIGTVYILVHIEKTMLLTKIPHFLKKSVGLSKGNWECNFSLVVVKVHSFYSYYNFMI
jgi:hypothetical protein